MNETTKVLIVAFVSIFLIVQPFLVSGQAVKDPIEKLKWLESADAIANARQAISKKDFRLRAIYGYRLIVPGADESKFDEYREKFGFNPIDGTSDTLLNEEHGRLNRLAFEYAQAYNKEILKFHKSDGL